MATRVTEQDIREENAAMRSELERIKNEAGKSYGTVAWVGPNEAGVERCVVRVGANYYEIASYPGVKPGRTVALDMMTMQITGLGLMTPLGSVATLLKLLDDGLAEVECHSGAKVVAAAATELKLERGCRVALDSSDTIVIANLGKPGDEYDRGETGVSWDDIGGQEEAKRLMIEAIELPHQFKDLHSTYGIKPPKGVALDGPPGCGKTMIGKAVATAIAKLHGADVKKGLGSGFIYVKGPELLVKWVGQSESNVRALFARARSHYEKAGYPAVIFLDEAESLLLKRGEGVSSDVNTTVVPSFLSEMDGIDESTCIVILATNRVDRIDPAILRDGRVDWKIPVARPTQDDVAAIMALNLRSMPLAKGLTPELLAAEAAEALFQEDLVLSTHKKGKQEAVVRLSDAVSGAMAANIVATAKRVAMRRDIAAGAKKPTGIGVNDMAEAIAEVFKQNKHLDHDDVLREVLERQQKQAAAERAPERAAAAA